MILRDANPHHLSAAAIVALIGGFIVFLTSGYLVIWEIGGWVARVSCGCGFILILLGAYAMAMEKKDEEDSEEGA